MAERHLLAVGNVVGDRVATRRRKPSRETIGEAIRFAVATEEKCPALAGCTRCLTCDHSQDAVPSPRRIDSTLTDLDWKTLAEAT